MRVVHSAQTSEQIDGPDWYAFYKYFCRSTPLSIRSNGRGQETVSATVSLLSLLAESIGALALDPRNPSSTRASKQALIIQVLSQV
jgi:hypothetical protein